MSAFACIWLLFYGFGWLIAIVMYAKGFSNDENPATSPGFWASTGFAGVVLLNPVVVIITIAALLMLGM